MGEYLKVTEPSGGGSTPTVVPDSVTVVDDAAIPATDTYVYGGFTAGQTGRFVLFGAEQTETSIFASVGGDLAIARLNQIPEAAATISVDHEAAPPGTAVRLVFMAFTAAGGLFKLVTDNAGSGNTYFDDLQGTPWLVEDVDATTQPGFALNFDDGSGDDNRLSFDSGGIFPSEQRFYVINPMTGQMIALSAAAGGAPIFLNTAAAANDRLSATMPSGVDQVLSVQDKSTNVEGLFVTKLYIDPTADTQSRLQHGNPFVTTDVYATGFMSENSEFKAVYNADAAIDGYELRYQAGGFPGNFAYNNTSTGTNTPTAFYTAADRRPDQVTQA